MLKVRYLPGSALSGLYLLGALSLASPRAAHAQGGSPSGESATNEAKELFVRGQDLFTARKFSDALDAMRGSYKLVPSPNSALMIARCLRELGRPVEALDMFTSTETDARRRVADGETKYAKTAVTAATEAALVRAGLGSLRVRIQNPGPGVDLTVDDVVTPIPADGTVVVWHTPGAARVALKRSGSPDQKQSVTVPSGGEVQMEFGASNATTTTPTVPDPGRGVANPPPPPGGGGGGEGSSTWLKPAIWTSGAVTVAGFGAFAGFGLASVSEYNAIKSQCGMSCTGSQTSNANTGKMEQTIANVGLAIGAVGAATTLTFVIIALTSHPTPSSTAQPAQPASPTAQLRLGLGSVGLDMTW